MIKKDVVPENNLKDLQRSDESLRQDVSQVLAKRKRLGLDGLVSGLQAVIINIEPQMQQAAVAELLRYSGLEFQNAFQDTDYRTCVLKAADKLQLRLRHLCEKLQLHNKCCQALIVGLCHGFHLRYYSLC